GSEPIPQSRRRLPGKNKDAYPFRTLSRSGRRACAPRRTRDGDDLGVLNGPAAERFLATPLFSLRENAIAKEPGLRYPERWPCVSRLGCSNGGSASFEASPHQTLSRGAFSAPSLVTPIR